MQQFEKIIQTLVMFLKRVGRLTYQILEKVMRLIIYFIVHKKHIYIVPLFYLVTTTFIVLISFYVFNHYIKTEHEDQIVMDFTGENNGPPPKYDNTYDLDGITVVIDPGHGGFDPGAPSNSGLMEQEVVYEYAIHLQERLEENGASVILTRGDNESMSLDDRRIAGDYFISLHSDTFEDPSINGFTVHHAHDYQISFAESISEGLSMYSPMYERGTRRNGFQVIWQIDYPGVLVELGYMSNRIDDYIITSYDYKEDIVEGLVAGLDIEVNGSTLD